MNNQIELLGIKFHFGIGFLSELIENTGMSLMDIGEKIEIGDVSVIPQLIYYSRLYAVKRDKGLIDFDIYDINDLVDENGGALGDFAKSFISAFMESLQKDVPVDENKKKATPIKK